MVKIKPAKSRSSNGGFTLVELLVVIAITGIMAAIAIMTVSTPQATSSTNSIANQLASDLSQVQQYNVSGNANYQISLGTTAYLIKNSSTIISTVNYPVNTTASPTGVFQFDNNGKPLGMTSTTFSCGTAAKIVTINAAGLIAVQ